MPIEPSAKHELRKMLTFQSLNANETASVSTGNNEHK